MGDRTCRDMSDTSAATAAIRLQSSSSNNQSSAAAGVQLEAPPPRCWPRSAKGRLGLSVAFKPGTMEAVLHSGPGALHGRWEQLQLKVLLVD